MLNIYVHITEKMINRLPSFFQSLLLIFTLLSGATSAQSADLLQTTIETLSLAPDRITGSQGAEQAAQYIEDRFEQLGLETENHYFSLPVREVSAATLTIKGQQYPINPFLYNAITPGATNGTLTGPLYYVGNGNAKTLDGKSISGSIILMEFDSGRNWQLLASLGAKALIYIDRGNSRSQTYFHQKHELSPLQFPCFIIDQQETKTLFGSIPTDQNSPLLEDVSIKADISWQTKQGRNIYTVIEGYDSSLKKELLIVEAFYDTSSFIPWKSPGSDEAVSIATLLKTAEELSKNPPKRSVMLIASAGHAQSLAGMRELMWSINVRSKELRKLRKDLKKEIKQTENQLKTLRTIKFPLQEDQERDKSVHDAILLVLKYDIDAISRHLIQLRLQEKSKEVKAQIAKVAEERFALRRLSWAENYHNLPELESTLLKGIIPKTIGELELLLTDLKKQDRELRSSSNFRQAVRDYEVAAIVSLHLSSHGDGVGAFHRGWLYNLKPAINRTGIYSTLAEVLQSGAAQSHSAFPYKDTLRGNGASNWQSWFQDSPQLGGEVSSLAGYIGISLVSTGDSRSLWGTPYDTPDDVNWNSVSEQAKLTADLVYSMGSAPELHSGKFPRDGLASVSAQTNLLLHGELFADYPAAGTTILAYQGLNRFYANVDRRGHFTIRGVADKKNVLDKLIIEGYRFDPETGKAIWAIDKKETGKKNYRLKMLRKSMKTDLVMFNCKETTVFDLLEPRSFNYMTKLHIFDGRLDATPQHYWYSRIDTRKSNISSIYLEPGAFLKLTLSDTVLTRKILLTNGTEKKPLGTGFPVDTTPAIYITTLQAAQDAWTLLAPRIENLESHGIFDEKINILKKRGLAALEKSQNDLRMFQYVSGREAAAESLALASRVYVQVEKTQKDVLFGVLFYIALFIPFAFCMERLLFNFASIYKRILGFSVVLAAVIGVIYQVHPAFRLTYSPMVVILAFFIIGLSLMVTLIIFFRFEEEMALLQRRASHRRPEEISRWKAFVAAFFLGVSNLRRRKLRTVLTSTTLIILTFTIMSFTTIKSSSQQNRLLFQEQAPYPGLLLKKLNWASLPPQAVDILLDSMQSLQHAAPRIWLEPANRSDTIKAPIQSANGSATLHGLIGLSPDEPLVTGLDSILTQGRWFNEDDTTSIILEQQMADRLQLSPGDSVMLWGEQHTVTGIFDATKLEEAIDLDGEPLTPVTFPDEAGSNISEVELEALESGDDVLSIQSRYIHIPATEIAILPAKTALAAGGDLKNIAVRPESQTDLSDVATRLTDRFRLVIFAGEKDGVWLYNISDTMNYSGVPNIIIPLLISVLIVLNTMISSVYERKGEIGVYTSVGLAPSHVAFLFVAEALALAVISVVIGYIIAQVSAALFSTTALWEGITVNYSSLAGVAAMLLVIAVVLISVIYPARVAAHIAIPDVNKTFTLPEPEDNTITVTLPFLMKYDENESIGGFIYQYFIGHQDISHGVFSTGPVDIIFSCSTSEEIAKMIQKSNRQDNLHSLHLRANVWLAPFDFGIMQEVDVQFCPALEGQNYLSIKVTLKRKAGEAGIWYRINSVFIHNLRKQLLIWRSLDDETHIQLAQSFRSAVPRSLSQTTNSPENA